MKYSHTPIFQKTYILTQHVYRASSNFKREFKYTLGEKLKNICHDLLDLIILANSSGNKEKLNIIKKLDYKFESLRIYLRLAYDLKIIGGGKLGILNEQIEDVGKQIGGWQRWAVKQ